MLAALWCRKRKCETLTLLLLVLVCVASLFVNIAKANGFMPEYVPPPDNVKAPIISVSPLENNTVYAQNEITLKLNVTTPHPNTRYSLYLDFIECQADWKNDSVKIYAKPLFNSASRITDFYDELVLSGIPDGDHNITFTASLHGSIGLASHPKYFLVYQSFDIRSSLTLNFTGDTIPPIILVAVLQNTTSTSVAVNYTINEPTAKIQCSLDSLSNTTATNGNMTLTNLLVGKHNVTVYAWDLAGNVGSSETIVFTVAERKPEISPVVSVATVSIASVSVVGAVLLVFCWKRRRQATQEY